MKQHLESRVVGQERLVQNLIIALLADGHVLLEGRPGVAKTRAVTVLAEALEGTFHRIVLGSESRGAELIGQNKPEALDRKPRSDSAPIFCNILLAEGIDRASPDARLVLLDAMAERHVLIDGARLSLPHVFLVCATRSTPQTGRGDPLDVVDLDRFLLCPDIDYLGQAAERRMLRLVRAELGAKSGDPEFGRLPLAVVLAARAQVESVVVGPAILKRITTLVSASRHRVSQLNDTASAVISGIGPRGSIALERCARVHAWLAGRRRVTTRDLAAVTHDVLRHRFALSEGAVSAGATPDNVIEDLLAGR